MDSTTPTSLYSIFKNVVQSFNTLLDCPVQFAGEYNRQKVHNFIEYIECYKRIKCITDEQALQEFQHLLVDESYIWWIQRKSHLTTWAEALTSLENQYSKQGRSDEMHTEFSESTMVDEAPNINQIHTESNTKTLFEEQFNERDNDDDNVIAEISSVTNSMKLPEPELEQVLPVVGTNQLDATTELNNEDIATEMPLLEKDQVENKLEPTNTVQEVQKPLQECQSTYTRTLSAKDFYINGDIPESVINQLITMIDESTVQVSLRKRVNLILNVPNAGRYRVALRKSRNSIKPVFSKKDYPRKEVNINKDQEEPYKKQQSQNLIENTVVNNVENTEIVHANERDPIIKVRRTEDLMPEIIDVDKITENEIKQEEFISDDIKTTVINSSHNSDESFQIDSDIMSQINNIIDESEMNMETEEENQHITTILPELPDNDSAIAYLYNGETSIQTEISTASKSFEPQSKSHSIIQKSNRCTFCRNKGHSYETCLKKAKQNKLIPDRVKSSDLLKDTEKNWLTFNRSDNDRTSSTSKISLINTQSLLNNSPTTFNTTNDISSILNKIPDKCVNTLLTTKLIEPMGGPSLNKAVAAKLRSTNVSMPKCHQCGTVGFYKSICPKCSPIYNYPNNKYD